MRFPRLHVAPPGSEEWNKVSAAEQEADQARFEVERNRRSIEAELERLASA